MKALVNKKATFNYTILEKIEAGLKLSGIEVKSIKSGRLSFEGSYISFRDNEIFWVNATIAPYQARNTPDSYEQNRPRKLLLNKKELNYLFGRSQERGLTILPLRVYTKRGNLKIEIGLAKSKKQQDKREVIKKRATDRDIQREMRKRS